MLENLRVDRHRLTDSRCNTQAMIALVSAIAFPVCRGRDSGSPCERRSRLRLSAKPRRSAGTQRETPALGGIGVFAGILAGVGLAIAVGAVGGSSDLLAILGGAGLLFAVGRLDDAFWLPALAKLGGARRRGRDRRHERPDGRAGEDRLDRGPDRGRLADGDDERVQPARQHGRYRGDARRDRLRLLRHRRGHRALERPRPRPLARASPSPAPAFSPSTVRRRNPRRRSSATPAARSLGSRWPRSRSPPAGKRRHRPSPPSSSRSSSSPSRSSTPRSSPSSALSSAALIHVGGRDDTSHRLVYTGLSEKRTLVLLARRRGRARRNEPRYNAANNSM